MPKGKKAKPPSRAKAEQGVATYFLAQYSGLFRPGAATILANSPITAKPKLTLPARPKYIGLGGPGGGSGSSIATSPPIIPPASLWATLDGVAANTAVSGGGLVATHSNSTLGGARTAAAKNSGNYYFEVTFTNLNGTNSGISILRDDTTYTGGSPNETDVILGLLPPTDINVGLIVANSGNTGQKIGAMGPAVTTVGVAVNFTYGLSWWRICPAGPWNGLPNPGTTDPNPAATGGVNGITIGGAISASHKATPAILFAGNNTETATVNFGQSAFVGVVPPGYTAGWPP
jgi:hypothetical protein